MQNETDVAGRQSRARGNFFVGKFIVKFQPHELAAAFVQRAEADADEADAFDAEHLGVGR